MNRRVVIIGAGGHAQVVADILRCAEETRLVGYLDDASHLWGKQILDAEVCGPIQHLGRVAHDAVILAIGENSVRSRLYGELKAAGEQIIGARHPQSVVAEDVKMGSGCVICAGVVINTGSVIGDDVLFNTACTIDHHNVIGSHVHIAPGVHTGGEVVIGEGTLVGIGATIMPCCKVGTWSIVGAGALVHHDLPDAVRAAGVPARILEKSGISGGQ